MASTLPLREDRDVSIGRVFQRAFSAITVNPFVVLGFALVIGALPKVLITQFFSGKTIAWAAQSQSPLGIVWAVALISFLIGLVLSSFVQAVLTRATVSADEGVRATFRESIDTGARVVLPLVVLSIISALGVTLGFLLLVVPGIIVMLMWSVAVPCLVIERRGILQAFNRSAELTQGAKWKILGLFAIVLAVYLLFASISAYIGFSGLRSGQSEGAFRLTGLIGNVMVSTVLNALWGTIQPSLYVELKQWKEGDSVDSLQEIFA